MRQVFVQEFVLSATSVALLVSCTNDLTFEPAQEDVGSGGVFGTAGASGTGGTGAMGDSGTGGAPVGCEGAQVCEGFEAGEGAFAIELMMGTAELTQERAYSGTTSLYSTTPGDNAWGQATFAFPPIGEGKAYFRAHYFIPAGTVTGLMNLFTIGQPDADSEIDIDVLSSGAFEVFYHADNQRYQSADALLPEDRWFCVRGEIDISSAAGRVQVWIDDASVLTTPATHNTYFSPGYSEIWIGIHWTENGQGPAEVFVDDVAVSEQPVACR